MRGFLKIRKMRQPEKGNQMGAARYSYISQRARAYTEQIGAIVPLRKQETPIFLLVKETIIRILNLAILLSNKMKSKYSIHGFRL
jgi:hypothetical protein